MYAIGTLDPMLPPVMTCSYQRDLFLHCYYGNWFQYGDSFTEDASDESLREAFKKVAEKVRVL